MAGCRRVRTHQPSPLDSMASSRSIQRHGRTGLTHGLKKKHANRHEKSHRGSQNSSGAPSGSKIDEELSLCSIQVIWNFMKPASWPHAQTPPGRFCAVVRSAHKTVAATGSPEKLASATQKPRPSSPPGMFIGAKNRRSAGHGARGPSFLATARHAVPTARTSP